MNLDFFSENSSLYFFSALLQADAAIFSIMAIFLVFRLEAHESAKSSIKLTMAQLTPKLIPLAWLALLDKNDIVEIERRVKDEEENCSGCDKGILALKKSFVEHSKKIDKIKNTSIIPAIVLAVVIVLFAAGIFFSAYLHALPTAIEFIVLLFALIAQIIVLAVIVWAVRTFVSL